MTETTPRIAEPDIARVSAAQLIVYAAPACGVGFMWGLLGLYYLKYATDVLLIAPATIGLLFGLSRIWDGLTDPVLGVVSDRTRSRFGRRRPWLAISCLPVGLLFYGLWSPPTYFVGEALVVWSALCLLLLYAALTMFNIPHKALGAEMERGYHVRTRVFASSGFAENIGTALAAGALALLEGSEAPRRTAALVSGGGGALTAGLILACAWFVRERIEHQRGDRAKNAYREMLEVVRNPYARILLGVFFFELLGQTTFISVLPYTSDYVLETPGSTFQYLAVALATTLVSIPCWIPLSRRFGKVQVWRASLLSKMVVFAALLGVGAGDRVFVIAISGLYGAAAGCAAVVAPSIKADVVDHDESLTGKRREGLYFSSWNLALKTAIGLALAFSGVVLSVTGFVPNVEQSFSAVLGIRALTSFFPMIFHGGALFLLMRFGLDAAEHARIQARIGRELA